MAELDLEHLLRPQTAGIGLEVFSVGPTSAQITWSKAPPGTYEIDTEHRTWTVDHDGGPGAASIDGLEPGSLSQLTVSTGGRQLATRDLPTLRPPPGERLFRFTTISDLHLGRGNHGYRGVVSGRVSQRRIGEATDPGPKLAVHADISDEAPVFCARSTIDDALAWGAELLVVKGDLCEETEDTAWALAADLLADLPVPVVVIPGNHDTGRRRHFEPEVGAAAHGVHLVHGVDHVDLDGLRIILVDSTVPGTGWGSVKRRQDHVAALAADAGAGVFIATHHQAQRFSVPLYWPHGIPGPEAQRFARAVRDANPRSLVSSGHTHRCRHRRVAGLDWSEVAATNHFPGVWAGYDVYDGGLVQMVRRASDPAALAWAERTRHTMRGLWALWSTGELSDRCFALTW